MQKRQGFTLIELSIVLVIIGLIIGGVLVGQDLIRSSQMRAVITAQEELKTAINTFRLKYNDMPGDMPNATTFWGDDCQANAPSPQACNGNDSGTIYGEGRLALTHLSNAGLIEGYYDLAQDSPTEFTVPWQVGTTLVAATSDIGLIPGQTRNLTITKSTSGADRRQLNPAIFATGAQNAGNAKLDVVYTNTQSPVFTTLEAQGIDEKIDDGHARGGKVWADDHGNQGCTGSDTAYPAPSYNLSTSGKVCMMYFGY